MNDRPESRSTTTLRAIRPFLRLHARVYLYLAILHALNCVSNLRLLLREATMNLSVHRSSSSIIREAESFDESHFAAVKVRRRNVTSESVFRDRPRAS